MQRISYEALVPDCFEFLCWAQDTGVMLGICPRHMPFLGYSPDFKSKYIVALFLLLFSLYEGL